MKDEFDGFIGYGEGIRSAEDAGVFDERPDLITNEENWDV